MVAASTTGNGQICTSSDSGMTWISNKVPIGLTWSCVASSSDGKGYWRRRRLLMDRFLPRQDSGTTWAQSGAPTNGWSAIATSADGTKLVAAAEDVRGDGLVYTSIDSGATWTTNNVPNQNWLSVVSSADGTKLAASDGVRTCVSADSGATWAEITACGGRSLACSADGNVLVAAQDFGSLYVSTNGGGTWIANNVPMDPDGGEEYFITLSADGTKLTAAVVYTAIYSSTNLGATWTMDLSTAGCWLDLNRRFGRRKQDGSRGCQWWGDIYQCANALDHARYNLLDTA